jgi:hypothetical protein
MRLLLVINSVVVLFMGCSRPLAGQGSAPGDPIDRLMTQVPFEDCPSYLYVPVDLPTNSSPTEVLEALSRRGTLRGSRITRFRVLEVRRVHSTQEGAKDVHYSAVLMDTNLGRKIALLQPQTGGWYYKIYDVR